MIDSYLRKPGQVIFIDPLAKLFSWLSLTPNHLTIVSACCGVLVIPALALQIKPIAIVLIILSGLLDACDGTLARLVNMSSNKGCILDIFCDRLVEFSVVIGLYLYEPNERGLLLLILLGSFYLCITSFLLSGIFSKNESEKSFHYSPGLIERSEAFIFFPTIILFDNLFFWGVIIFSALTYITALNRFREMIIFNK